MQRIDLIVLLKKYNCHNEKKRSEIAESSGSYIFNFLKILHIVFHSGTCFSCTNLQFHHSAQIFPSPYTQASMLSLDFWMIAALTL